ncbi:MAG TPA: preprotein translocase subunit SecG [Candidatus Acidoferrum sp.]
MPSWMKWAIALAIGFAIIGIGFRISWGGTWILKPFFIMNCLVLVIVVLLQSGKAADLAGAFGGAGSQTAFGPRGAANVLSKATTWCAVMFMVCSFAMVVRTDKAVEQGGSILQKVSQPAPKPVPATIPGAPQPDTHNPLPTGQQPVTQPAGSQAPASSQPAPATSKPPQNPPASSSAPATSKPAQQAPATPPPAPAPTKKP